MRRIELHPGESVTLADGTVVAAIASSRPDLLPLSAGPYESLTRDAAIAMFGSVATLAEAIGISGAAIRKWPVILPRRLEDRVLAAEMRRRGLLEFLTGGEAERA